MTKFATTGAKNSQSRNYSFSKVFARYFIPDVFSTDIPALSAQHGGLFGAAGVVLRHKLSLPGLGRVVGMSDHTVRALSNVFIVKLHHID